ncbi:hypothetical protein ABZY09_04275 [Streptomyces sp. NPDC002928]|uniref:hypothetical protein n=1 Tax=Streptomyces sp. NPDC002928 TaxID=3154440 RepID=UPI0033A1060A
MPRETPNEHFKSGQLLAALWTLRLLVTPGAAAPERDEFLAKKAPVKLLNKELPSLAGHLILVKRRGSDRWEAAVEIFREIPGFLPPGRLPVDTMGPPEQRAFADGYAEQLAKYKEKWSQILA